MILKTNNLSEVLGCDLVCTLSRSDLSSDLDKVLKRGYEVDRINDYESMIGSLVVNSSNASSLRGDLISKYIDRGGDERISIYGYVNSLLKVRDYISRNKEITEVAIPNIEDNELVTDIVDKIFLDTPIIIKCYDRKIL